MIYILTALSAEAHPVIEALHLKKQSAAGRFRIYENEGRTVTLVITGPGGILSAAAVGMLLGTAKREDSFLISFGCCADISAAGMTADGRRVEIPDDRVSEEQYPAEEISAEKRISEERRISEAGGGQYSGESKKEDRQSSGREKLYLANKLTNLDSGRTFYPDLLIQSSLPEAEIITGSRVLRASADGKQLSDSFWREDSQNHPADSRERRKYPGADRERLEDSQKKEASGRKGFIVSPILYDMESAAIYEAGSAFLGPHQMSFLRAVSDRGEGELVSAKDVDRCVRAVLPEFLSYCRKAGQFLQDAEDAGSCGGRGLPNQWDKDAMDRKERKQRGEYTSGWNESGSSKRKLADHSGAAGRICESHQLEEHADGEPDRRGKQSRLEEKLAADLHCSAAMRHQLDQLLRYCTAAGIAWGRPVHAMYTRGILPAGDRREGKKVLAHLHAELIQNEGHE